jgi:hypothetical protein
MNEREHLAAALYQAERNAFNFAGAPATTRAMYLCLADVAIETLDALRKPPAPEPEPGEDGLIDPQLPGFDISQENSASWQARMGL